MRVELEDGGVVEAEAAAVTLPTSLLDGEAVRFDPPLPDKADAAAALPLGCAGVLARPEGRLLFAGEACSRGAYSGAHGAYGSRLSPG